MDTSTGVRGRGRKRHTLPITLPYKSSEVTEQTSSETPSANMATRSLTFDTPSPSASRETRMRARYVDSANASPEDPTSKGGRSLRKRPRVDYTFDNLEETDNHGAKATPATTRPIKRRKLEFPNDSDAVDDFDSRTKRRASEQPQSSSIRRRNYTRKSTVEPQTHVPEEQMDDVEVQDTIEVGGHHSSESDGSILRRASSGSSNSDLRAPLNNTSLDLFSTPQPMDLQTDQRSTAGATQPNYLHDLQQDVEDEDEAVDDGLIHRGSPTYLDGLAPYIAGSYTYYPEYSEDELDADADVNSEAGSDATREADADATADLGSQPDINEDATQQDTVANDVATDGLTAVVDDQADGPIEDTPAETTANTPEVAKPANTPNAVKNQFRFKKLPPASQFLDLLSDAKSLSPEDLYYRAEAINRCLVAWQEEYNELRKFTDDHDNSIRYHKEEEAFDRRFQAAVDKDQKLPEKKDFVVKGVRADMNADPDAYVRQQDRIMANAYGFTYNPSEEKIGMQDPIAQRTSLGRNGRLRDRTIKTSKAAEAEDLAQGRRNRKAPERYNGGDPISRGSSPAPAQRRVRRNAQALENTNLTGQTPITPTQLPEPVEPEPKKKGKGGRPRKNPLPEPAIEATPAPVPEPIRQPWREPTPIPSKLPKAKDQPKPKAKPKTPVKSQAKSGAKAPHQSEVEHLPNGEPEVEQKSSPKKPSPKRGAEEMEEEKQPVRKRGRRAPATSAPATTPAAEDADVANGAESRPGDQGEEIRPPTASSTATVATVASTGNYQLREKRQRKFTNDINDDDFLEEPKPKRARAAPKRQTKIKNITAPYSPPAPAPAQQPDLDVAPAPKASKIIKLKVPSSSRGQSVVPSVTPAPAPTTGSGMNGNGNGNVTPNGAAEPKDYSTMTKSEKMSASMKARWNSGSMNGAVQKRRATLAAKKQNAKTPAPTTPTNPEQGQTLLRPSEDTESEDNKDGVATEQ
ncbi:hypothetical protein F4818DRAFT_184724 [Hypoxylon cercidicola]|nr:hypothetical protein F4818DRAFT_184724 [Hypoxylon cercidicola]